MAPGVVPRYFHTYVGSDHFLGFKILNFNIFFIFFLFFIFFFGGGGGSEKIIIFRGMKIFGYSVGVITNDWTSLRGHFYVF